MNEETTDTGIGNSISAAQQVLSAIQGVSQIASLILAAVGDIETKKAAAVGAIEQSKNDSIAAIRVAAKEPVNWQDAVDRPPGGGGGSGKRM